MMVLPVIPHRLTKIRAQNRVRLIKIAFLFSLSAAVANVIGVGTNQWLHTREVLKYYIFPNRTIDNEDKLYPPTYYKNSTLGPWRFCWSDLVDPLLFNHEDEPSDVTTSVELSVRRTVPFMLGGCALNVLGLCCNMVCLLRSNPYQSLFFATLTNIFAGLANFTCIILYMASVSKEVGNKLYKASELDNSLFDYSYGFSFISLKVYMSKRDERTYNAHRMRSMLRSLRGVSDAKWTNKDAREQQLLDNQRYHRHTRMNTLRRHSRNITMEELQQLKNANTNTNNNNNNDGTLATTKLSLPNAIGGTMKHPILLDAIGLEANFA